jgi:hypothetical protein
MVAIASLHSARDLQALHMDGNPMFVDTTAAATADDGSGGGSLLLSELPDAREWLASQTFQLSILNGIAVTSQERAARPSADGVWQGNWPTF